MLLSPGLVARKVNAPLKTDSLMCFYEPSCIHIPSLRRSGNICGALGL